MSRSLLVFVGWMILAAWLLRAPRGGETFDLGLVRYPAGSGPARIAVHDWDETARGDHYRLTYAHGTAAGSRLEADHAGLGERFAFRWGEGGAFLWRAPAGCGGREWECIYAEVLERSGEDLEPVLARFEASFRAGEWTTVDAARWLLAFVQQIPYRLPNEHAFGVLPPALVASHDWGDCDSKSLLLIALLGRLGIDSVLLVSQAHAHALVGVDVPAGPGGFRHRGREYAWAETTAVDAPLGWLHPRMRLPDDWRVVPLPEARSAGTMSDPQLR